MTFLLVAGGVYVGLLGLVLVLSIRAAGLRGSFLLTAGAMVAAFVLGTWRASDSGGERGMACAFIAALVGILVGTRGRPLDVLSNKTLIEMDVPLGHTRDESNLRAGWPWLIGLVLIGLSIALKPDWWGLGA